MACFPIGRKPIKLRDQTADRDEGQMASWNHAVFRYCERGLDPTFWAEPVNALSNVAFPVAALLAWRALISMQSVPLPELRLRLLQGLIGLVAVVGLGSFTFHTHATRFTEAADVVPIGTFMLAALWLALRWGLNWPIPRVALALAVFMATTLATAALVHAAGCGQPIATARGLAALPVHCLNGGWTYVPTLMALIAVTTAVRTTAPSARPWFWAASVALAFGLTLRTLDLTLCPIPIFASTHAVWHLCAAASAYAILRASFALAYARAAP